MLAHVLAGERPAGGTCPVATVVIPGGEKGDRLAGSPEVKVLVGWAETKGLPPQELKGQWVSAFGRARSDPSGGRATRQVVAIVNLEAPKSGSRWKRMAGWSGVPSPWRLGEGQCHRRRNWANAADGLPGV